MMSGSIRMQFSLLMAPFSLLTLKARVDNCRGKENLGRDRRPIFRSLYEFMYAYEQIERERSASFGICG